MRIGRLVGLFGLCLLTMAAIPVSADESARPKVTFGLGFFEGGETIHHNALRTAFMEQLLDLLPDSVHASAVPAGYGNGEWKRDKCRQEARRLTEVPGIDLMVALGPWTAEALLEAGYAGPILGMHRVDPALEGLLDADGRPVADNLTVHHKTGQLRNDLAALADIVSLRKLGVLYFPSGDESALLIDRIAEIGRDLGFIVSTTKAYDNYGTFAYFKAYRQLDRSVDAIYLMPFWGMNDHKTNDFLEMVNRDGTPTLAWEGTTLVPRGATVGNTGISLAIEARFNAAKAVRILLDDAVPADLPTVATIPPSLLLNDSSLTRSRANVPVMTLSDAIVVDPTIPEPEHRYSLRAAVRRAIEVSPSIAAAETGSAVQLRTGSRQPELTAWASWEYGQDDSRLDQAEVWEDSRPGFGLSFTQPLLTIAERRLASAVHARQDRDAAARIARHALEAEVIGAYFDLLQTRQSLAVETAMRARIEAEREQAAAVYLVDSVARIDYLLWIEERNRAANRCSSARQAVHRAQVNLNALLNHQGEAAIEIDTAEFAVSAFEVNLAQLEILLSSEVLRELVRSGLVGRGAVEHPSMALWNDVVAGSRTTSKAAAWSPELRFRADLGWRERFNDDHPRLDEDNTTWELALDLRAPLLGTGAIIGGRSGHTSNDAAEYRRDAASLEVMRSVLVSFEAFVVAIDRADRAIANQELMTVVGNELRQADRRPDSREMMDLLDRMRFARLEAIASRIEFYRAAADLLNAVGVSVLDQRRSLLQAVIELTGRG